MSEQDDSVASSRIACPACGYGLPSDARFCGNCRHELSPFVPTAPVQRPILPAIMGVVVGVILLSLIGSILYGSTRRKSGTAEPGDTAQQDEAPGLMEILGSGAMPGRSPAASPSSAGIVPKYGSGANTQVFRMPTDSDDRPQVRDLYVPEPIPPSEPEPDEEAEDLVWLTDSREGDAYHYHRKDCQLLAYQSYPVTRQEAEAEGYKPCATCISQAGMPVEGDQQPAPSAEEEKTKQGGAGALDSATASQEEAGER